MKLPRHEEEVIKAAARAYRGDDEKVPTTAIRGLKVEGVGLSSRYNKARELEAMARMVKAVEPHLRPHMTSVFCDSKGGACYSVELEGCDEHVAAVIGRQMEYATTGHNGIYLTSGGVAIAAVDPYWPDDFPDTEEQGKFE